jgi:hypothetical protein
MNVCCLLQHGENPQLPHIKNNRDCELLCKTYLTTNSEVHDFKYNVHKNTEVSVLPIQCARQTFMRSTNEKVWRYRGVESFLNLTHWGRVFFLYIYHRSLIRSEVTFLQTSGPEDHSEKHSMYCVMKCVETKRMLKTQICIIRLSQL